MYVCRICSKHSEIEECVHIEFKIAENKSILDLLKEWASIKVFKDDKLPEVICKICLISVKSFANFINIIRKSDQEFRKLLYKSDHSSHVTEQNILNNKPNQASKTSISVISESAQNNKDKNNFENPVSLTPDFLENIVHTNKSDIVSLKKEETLQNSGSFECLTCQKTFKKSHQLKNHMTMHSGERKYSCKICGKHFARSYVLLYHMRVHTGEKRFNCNFCNKSFIHPSNLYKHKKIHTDTRNYKCELCSKSFIQSETLKIHIRRIHTGEKPFLCEVCSKSFSCQSALWLHKQDTHLQKESCPVCEKQFSSRMLKQHIERHKNKEQEFKKCICDQCGKNFSSDHNLRQHLLIHDGIKPYASQPMPCPLCRKLYSKRRIKSHICISSGN